MGTITLPNVRATSDITAKVRLKYGGMPIDFRTLTDIKAWIYSDAQKAIAGRCLTTIEGEEGDVLSCLYTSTKPQYLGINRVIIQAKYHGQTNTYDKPAFNIVKRNSDLTEQVVVIEDASAEEAVEVDVNIEITEVSTGLLDRGIAAAIDAADEALKAAEEAKRMVDIHRGPVGPEGPEGPVGPVGNGVQSIEQTEESHESEGVNIITVTMTDGTQATFSVRNGEQGKQGIQGVPGVANAKYKQVDTLPTPSAETLPYIYLTPSETAGVFNMSYTEEDGTLYAWKPLGTTAIQMTDYATKVQLTAVDEKVNDYAAITENNVLVPSSEINGLYIVDGTGRTATFNGYKGNVYDVRNLSKVSIHTKVNMSSTAGSRRYAFYSSDSVFDSTTAIDVGGSLPGNSDFTTEHVVPEGAVSLLLVTYGPGQINQEAIEIVYNPVSGIIPGINQRLQRLEQDDIIVKIEDVPMEGRDVACYITRTGALADTSPNDGFIIYKYPVTPGDTIYIKNTLHVGASYCYGFYNSADFSDATAVLVGPAVTSAQDITEAVVPEGATYIGVQHYIDTTQGVKKEVLQPIKQIVEDLVTQVEENTDALTGVKKAKMAYYYAGSDSDLFVAYNTGHGIEYTFRFRKCMANQLFTFYTVGYREVERAEPYAKDIGTDTSIVVINQTSSDNIGPISMSYGGWVGGNHLYHDTVKTAKTERVKIYANGKQVSTGESGECDEVNIIVENTIFDPSIAPAEGAEILPEKLCTEIASYVIRKSTIEVALSHDFVNSTTNNISLYYGMQSMFQQETHFMTPNGEFINWHEAGDFTGNFKKQDYPHFNRFIEKKNAAYQASLLYSFALGKHNAIGGESRIFTRSSNKDYHVLIDVMRNMAGKHIQWEGGYTFFNAPIVDDDYVFAYPGVYMGKDALFINTKKAYFGAIAIPSDMVIRKSTILECIGITDEEGGNDFHVGGSGLYIRSESTGSLILVFE